MFVQRCVSMRNDLICICSEMRRTQLLRRRYVCLREPRLNGTSLITDRQYCNLLLFLWIAVSHSTVVNGGQDAHVINKDKS